MAAPPSGPGRAAARHHPPPDRPRPPRRRASPMSTEPRGDGPAGPEPQAATHVREPAARRTCRAATPLPRGPACRHPVEGARDGRCCWWRTTRTRRARGARSSPLTWGRPAPTGINSTAHGWSRRPSPPSGRTTGPPPPRTTARALATSRAARGPGTAWCRGAAPRAGPGRPSRARCRGARPCASVATLARPTVPRRSARRATPRRRPWRPGGASAHSPARSGSSNRPGASGQCARAAPARGGGRCAGPHTCHRVSRRRHGS